jgi:DNA-binding protein WhiA
MSNISKTVEAANAHIAAIEYIDKKKGLSFLPDVLQKIARLRLEHREASLSELGKLLDEPISRSGVNHRFKKLAKIADEIRGEIKNDKE